MRSSTAKSIAAIALTGVGSALVVGFRTADTPVAASTTISSSSVAADSGATSGDGSGTTSGNATSGTDAGTTDTGTTDTGTTSSGSSSGGSATALADGTYTGEAVQEPWGTFQVEAVVSGGQLTDVVVVSAPQDGHSSRINSQAVPILTEAVLAAQGTGVDLVSGATWTSESYLTSLQAALDVAQAALQNAA